MFATGRSDNVWPSLDRLGQVMVSRHRSKDFGRQLVNGNLAELHQRVYHGPWLDARERSN